MFPGGTEIIGCYFHFKQALLRKLKSWCSDNAASFISQCISFVTIIPEEEVELAFEYLEEKVQNLSEISLDVFHQFKDYFFAYWMPKFHYWNISRFNYDLRYFKRTNNALERYNRRLNSKFPNAHPTIVQFAATLRKEECYFTQYIRSIQTGIQYLEEPEESYFPNCDDFREWCMERESLIVSQAPEVDDKTKSDSGSLDYEKEADSFYNFESEDSWENYLDTCGAESIPDENIMMLRDDMSEIDDTLARLNNIEPQEGVLSDRKMQEYIWRPKQAKVPVLRKYLNHKGIIKL
jgi:hypothetical protein